MSQPAYRVSSNGYMGGFIVLKWTNSRGYIQQGGIFDSVYDARAYIDAKGK